MEGESEQLRNRQAGKGNKDEKAKSPSSPPSSSPKSNKSGASSEQKPKSPKPDLKTLSNKEEIIKKKPEIQPFKNTLLQKETFFVSVWIFIRLMGFLYLTAFISAWTQIYGLIGSTGISPVDDLIVRLSTSIQSTASFWTHPSLFWINSSDDMIMYVCLLGCTFSSMLIFDIIPILSAIVCWVLYLSISSVGQNFFNQQWDMLLLESGFLLIMLCPMHFSISPFSKSLQSYHPPYSVLWLFRLLLLRVNLSRGILQLIGKEGAWRTLSTFYYLFETQPSPTPLSWYADKLGDRVQEGLVFWVLTIEIAISLLVITPQFLRRTSCFYIVSLQIFYILTGNLGTYHWNIIILCILLIDDSMFVSILRLIPFLKSKTSIRSFYASPLFSTSPKQPPPPFPSCKWRRRFTMIITLSLLMLSVVPFCALTNETVIPPTPLITAYQHIYPFKIINIYTPFSVIYEDRYEIIIQASMDAQNWLPYQFYSKPDLTLSAPLFISPHFNRLEYALWSAAQSDYNHEVWISRLLHRLLDGEKHVRGLFKSHPLTDVPQYARAIRYLFEFTKPGDQPHDSWWKSTFVDIYTPTFTQLISNDIKKGKII